MPALQVCLLFVGMPYTRVLCVVLQYTCIGCMHSTAFGIWHSACIRGFGGACRACMHACTASLTKQKEAWRPDRPNKAQTLPDDCSIANIVFCSPGQYTSLDQLGSQGMRTKARYQRGHYLLFSVYHSSTSTRRSRCADTRFALTLMPMACSWKHSPRVHTYIIGYTCTV